MKRGCSFSSLALIAASMAVCGCAGTRPLTSRSSVKPPEKVAALSAEKSAAPEKRLSPEHLQRVGDLLAAQGRKDYAREVYDWARQRKPSAAAPRNHLVQGQQSPRSSQTSPNAEQTVAKKFPANIAPPQKESLRQQPDQLSPPPLPAMPGKPVRKQVSGSRSAMTVPRPSAGQFPALAQGPPRPVSQSSDNGAEKGQRVHSARSREFTIRVIPATRTGPPRVTEFRFPATSGEKTSGEKKPVAAHPERNNSRVAQTAGDSAGHRPAPGRISSLPASSAGERSSAAPRPFPATPSQELTELKPAAPALQRKPVAARLPHHVKVQREMARLAGWLRQPEKHLDEIASRLMHEEPLVRAMAAFLLGRAGHEAAPLVPRVEDALRSEKEGRVSVRLAEALLRIQPEHALGISTLLQELNTSERSARWEAVCVADVLRSGPAEEAAVAVLLKRLHDADSHIAVMAALKLGEFPAAAAKTGPVLQQLVARKETGAKLRRAAAASLRVLKAKSGK